MTNGQKMIYACNVLVTYAIIFISGVGLNVAGLQLGVPKFALYCFSFVYGVVVGGAILNWLNKPDTESTQDEDNLLP